MKKGHKPKKGLILLILSFLLVTTSVYAWFSVNRFATIDFLNINIDARRTLQISVDSLNWQTLLSSNDIRNARDNFPNSRNQLPYLFQPVSSGGEVDTNSGLLKMFLGETQIYRGQDFHSLRAVRSIEEEGVSGHFMAFDVFLRVDQPSNIYLTNESGPTNHNEDEFGIENAMRVAFLIQGHSPEMTGNNRIQNLTGATNQDVFIWEPNYDVHTATGVANARDRHGITTTMTDAARIPYDGIITEFPISRNVPISRANSRYFPDLFRPVDIALATRNGFETNQFLFRIERGITKIRVYVWVEGQDVDCEDNSSHGQLEMRIGFSTLP